MMKQTDGWYVLNRGKISGPFPHAQIEAMRQQGLCNAFTKISQDRMNWQAIDEYLAACRAAARAPAPLRPPVLPGSTQASSQGSPGTAAQALARVSSHDVLRPLPLIALLLLHYLTLGVFSFFWVTGLIGILPKTRASDPSTAKAVGLAFVPFYNLYWFFILYPRLAVRLNALSKTYFLPEIVPVPLAYTICVLMVIPVGMAMAGSVILMIVLFSPTSKWEVAMFFFAVPNILTLINFLFVAPIFAERVQRTVNNISDAQISGLIANQA